MPFEDKLKAKKLKLYENMPIEGTRSTKISSTTQPELDSAEVGTNMADINDEAEGLPDRDLLLRIISNQK